MSELDGGGQPTGLEQEALAHVRHLVSGSATVDDLEEVKRWQHLSPAHAEAFAFATRFWDRLGPAGRNVVTRQSKLASHAPNQARTMSRRAVLAGGAAAAAYLVVRPPLQLWPSFSELSADYRTAIGEQRRITLASGTSVELNTRTSIALRHPTDGTDRIELIGGEAAITTGPQLATPLVVFAGDGQVVSQSASFNVRHDGIASSVTCLEGTVRVRRDTFELMLGVRQQVSYGGWGLQSPVTIDPALVTAWQNGFLVFHETAMSEVVAEINRYRSGKIVLLNADLGRRQVNARFRVGNVDEIMSLAHRAFGARITSLPGGIVLLS